MSLLRAFSLSTLKVAIAPLTAVAVLTAGTTPAPAPERPAPPASSSSRAATTDRAPAQVTQVALAVDPADAVEERAIEVAHGLGAVPADAADAVCPREDLVVRWSEPEGYTHGAYVAPVGPAPGRATTAVNGAVVCADSTWAFMGFEAVREGDVWHVSPVPYVAEAEDDPAAVNLDADPDAGADAPARAPAARPSAPAPAPAPSVPTSAWLAGLGPIEPYAAYEPQASCSPTAKPGTVVLRDALLAAHPSTRNLGIARACHIGGRSEHKEGRAFDWGAYVHRPVERAAVDRFLTQLFATDAQGNRHALARRMGVMYVIWNRQIWSSSRPGDGWRLYHGPSPHTDHVHISLSRAGATGQTSFFTAGLAQRGVLGAVPPGGMPLPSAPVAPSPGGTDPVSAAPSDDEERRDGGGRKHEEPARREEDTLEPVRREEDEEQERLREEEAKREEAARREAEKAAEAERRALEESRKATRKAEEKAGRGGGETEDDQVAPASVSTDRGPKARATSGKGSGGERGKGGGKGGRG